MRNSTNSKRSSRTIAIAAGVLWITLGAGSVSAASQQAGSAAGAPAAAHAAVDSKGQGTNNGQRKGNKHRFELPIDWFHQVLGSVGSALKSVTSVQE